MDKKTEALKLALEALDDYLLGDENLPFKCTKALATIREALAEQPEPQSHCNDCGGFDPDCPLAQPAQQQEPVAWINWCAATGKRSVSFECESELASQPLYEGITQNTQDHYSKFHSWFDSELHRQKYTQDHPAYLAAQEAWNAANDAAQYRINRLNAEIEAWKVRFKIAEDALAKLNGPEQKPVAYGLFINGELSWDSEWAFSNESFPVQFDDEECRPLYTSPQPAQQRPQNCGTGYCSCIECLFDPEQPAQQEPIYQMQMMDGKWIDQAKQSYEYNKAHGHTVRIVYTSPPASKPWVGLTPKEKKEIERLSFYVEGAIRHTEAKLREKNEHRKKCA